MEGCLAFFPLIWLFWVVSIICWRGVCYTSWPYSLSIINYPCMWRLIFGLSILYHCSEYLFVRVLHSFNYYSFRGIINKIWERNAFLFLLRIVLAIWNFYEYGFIQTLEILVQKFGKIPWELFCIHKLHWVRWSFSLCWLFWPRTGVIE